MSAVELPFPVITLVWIWLLYCKVLLFDWPINIWFLHQTFCSKKLLYFWSQYTSWRSLLPSASDRDRWNENEPKKEIPTEKIGRPPLFFDTKTPVLPWSLTSLEIIADSEDFDEICHPKLEIGINRRYEHFGVSFDEVLVVHRRYDISAWIWIVFSGLNLIEIIVAPKSWTC